MKAQVYATLPNSTTMSWPTVGRTPSNQLGAEMKQTLPFER